MALPVPPSWQLYRALEIAMRPTTLDAARLATTPADAPS